MLCATYGCFLLLLFPPPHLHPYNRCCYSPGLPLATTVNTSPRRPPPLLLLLLLLLLLQQQQQQQQLLLLLLLLLLLVLLLHPQLRLTLER